MSDITGITIVSLAIATIIPIIALFIIYTMDLYSTGAFRFVVLCFFWGGIAFAAASLVNSTLTGSFNVDIDLVRRFIAPFEEELFKGILLLFLVWRKEFTYFVDGAIYGFAIGIGFAIFENYQYLLATNESSQLLVAIVRVVSTNLMHATCSAIIGIVMGYSRFSKRSGVFKYILAALAASITIHTIFNNIANTKFNNALFLILFIVLIGIFGFGFIIYFIRRGTNEARIWIKESLGMADRVTAGEAKAVDQIRDIEVILTPLAEVFGEEKARQIEKLLQKQARLGILRKNLERLQDEKLKENTRAEITSLRAAMEEDRSQIGPYAMMTLRGIFPDEDNQLWEQLEDILTQRIAAAQGPQAGGLWDKLGSSVTPPPSKDS